MLAGACAGTAGPGSGSGDVDSGVTDAAVEALSGWGILEGTECRSGGFCPQEPVERWVMAVWLVRALDELPAALTGSGGSRFSDVDAGQWWAPYVERLAELEITPGCSTGPLQYCPDGVVTRAEMAAYIARAFALEQGIPAGFVDTADNVHEASIDALATARITVGCATDPLRFCPDEEATRAEMATYLARAAGLVQVPTPTGLPVPPRPGAYVAVSAGLNHTCAVRTDRTVACWGANDYGQADVPFGTFSAVAAGFNHTCAVRTDKSITCWGENQDVVRQVPPGAYTAVSSGDNYSCAIRTDGTVACWGSNLGMVDPPEGTFTAISAGVQSACGLGTDRTVNCWGIRLGQKPDTSAGMFAAVDAGGTQDSTRSCGIRSDRTIICWGVTPPDETRSAEPGYPPGAFTAVSVGGSHKCGLRTDQTIFCWGSDPLDREVPSPPGRFTAVSSNYYYSCGLRTDQTITCWGDDNHAAAPRPTEMGDRFTDIATGTGFSCGLRSDRTLACWGSYGFTNRQIQPPGGTFTELVAGRHLACAIRADWSVVCWGVLCSDSGCLINGPPSDGPVGSFTEVSSTTYPCGLQTDQTITCWAPDPPSQVIHQPDGEFTTFSSGHRHACGIRTDRTLACWRLTTNRTPSALMEQKPDGNFTAVAVGSITFEGSYACAIRTNRTVTCWGPDSNVTTDVPEGQFITIAAERDHACGIRTDQTIRCWGTTFWDTGQTHPPPGDFTSITVGDPYSCGKRTDGTFICWGHLPIPAPDNVNWYI